MEIYKTDDYNTWFSRLKDLRNKARINARLRRCELSGEVVGDKKHIAGSIWEMRFMFGPGYRIYYQQNGKHIILLLIGGDKSSQKHDIEKAQQIARELEGSPWQ